MNCDGCSPITATVQSQLGGAPACEQASNITKVGVGGWAYGQSTAHLLRPEAGAGTGTSCRLRSDPPGYRRTLPDGLDWLFSVYSTIVRELACPIQRLSHAAGRPRIRMECGHHAKACDAAGASLPAATLSNVSFATEHHTKMMLRMRATRWRRDYAVDAAWLQR